MPRVKMAQTCLPPEEITRRIILSAMGRCGIDHQKDVAAKLGISKAQFSRKMSEGKWNLSDIRKLNRLLSFTTDEALVLVGIKKSVSGGAV